MVLTSRRFFFIRFCWGGNFETSQPVAKATLEGRRNHSTSSVDKYYSGGGFLNHFSTPRAMSPETVVSSGVKTPTARSPLPISNHAKSNAQTPVGRSGTSFSTTPTQTDYDCSGLLEGVVRSLQGSPIGTPLPSPPRALRPCVV
jgi:hypothetical protein